ncbi:hypothetical protein [Mucilaginibacter sp. UYCu711]|uniref:hypothetical protein n=1 Tax=Mucilaginibacter sp. UYCu711 TaxID=3156339 RepID=UPI003D2596F2
MGKSLERRRRLFRKFSGQLLLLKANGLIDIDFKYAAPYLCPICLREFSEDHLDESKHQNFLTAEDAPPDALGGTKIALTCRECNNRCGQEIDWHLIEAIKAVDDSFFYKGSKRTVTTVFEGQKITTELTALGDGNLTAYHRIKHNDPGLLEKFIYGLKNKTIGPALNFEPPVKRFIQERINYALVKTNYIITFAKFGYIFLLNPRYQDIRNQLRHPGQVIYPWNPFVKNPFTAANIGTYYVLNEDIKSILNVFRLKTGYSETIIGGFLHHPNTTMEDFGALIDGQCDANNSVIFDTSTYDAGVNVFEDLAEINKIRNWFLQ